jgi:SAM-dependent methyltransferase
VFLDLGYTPPADQFLRKEQLKEPETYYPLRVAVCDDCGLIQLDHVVSPEVLYKHDYPYESSITNTGQKHWKEFADTVSNLLQLKKDDLVVDIGSNVGVLLSAFKENGVKILGVDPATNIVRIAEQRGIETLNEFFNLNTAEMIVKSHGRASVITGTNVFAHIDDLDNIMDAVLLLMKEDGSFVVEAPYFAHLLENLEYDTIYHEHVSYISIKPLARYLNSFGLEIYNIQQRDIHGGSVRIFISRMGKNKVDSIVSKMIQNENEAGIYTHEKLFDFAKKVAENRMELTWLIRKLKSEGNRIVAVSAPAKGMTLLNYCRLGNELIDFVTEKSTLKIGRYTPGVHIPVTTDQMLVDEMPEYALLLAWNFAEEIMNNLSEYKRKGGKFIIPIPKPIII